jgi:hypothetical protein
MNQTDKNNSLHTSTPAFYHYYLQYPIAGFWWLALSVIVLAADYASGPLIHFPVLFLIPVACASWFTSLAWGTALAVLLSLTRLVFYIWWDAPQTFFEAGTNALVRVVVFVAFSFLVNTVAQHTRALLREVKVLHGLLPICASCKKIRSKDNSWTDLETYIIEHSEALFSHGICPDCLRTLYPEFTTQQKND